MSCHHTSRPSVQSTSCPVRRTTRTCSTDGHASTASSTAGFSAICDPRRFWPSAVMTSLARRVVDPAAQRLGREPGEHHGVRGAEPRARQHRDHGLGDHRQVDRDAVAGLHAELRQRMGRLGDLDLQLGVGDVEPVAGLALEPDRDLVAVAGLHVAVDAVVGDVEPAADEPLRERRARPVEHLGERLGPRQVPRLLRPEPQPVGRGLARTCSGWALACAANSALGGNRRSSWERLDRASFDGFWLVTGQVNQTAGLDGAVFPTRTDPLAVLAADERVSAAVLAAREEVDALLWRRDVRAAAAEVAAASIQRGARDSAAMDGADVAVPDESPMGRVLEAALRLTAAVPTQVDVFTGAPLQAWAHLHALTAHGFVADGRAGPAAVGRDGRRPAQPRRRSCPPPPPPSGWRCWPRPSPSPTRGAGDRRRRDRPCGARRRAAVRVGLRAAGAGERAPGAGEPRRRPVAVQHPGARHARARAGPAYVKALRALRERHAARACRSSSCGRPPRWRWARRPSSSPESCSLPPSHTDAGCDARCRIGGACGQPVARARRCTRQGSRVMPRRADPDPAPADPVVHPRRARLRA